MTNWNGLELPESYFRDDNVYLIHGDSAEILADFPEKCVDLTVTSPPYDNLRNYNGYKFEFEVIAKELYRTHKDGGVVVWVVGDATIKGSETGTSFRQALYFKSVGFNLHDTMIYEKTGASYPAGSKSNRYSNVFEYMFILSRSVPKTVHLLKDKPNKWAGSSTFGVSTNRQRDGSLRSSGKRTVGEFGYRDNIWRIPNGKGFGGDSDSFSHPASFPETIAQDHILSWSKDNDIILDPFLGSGTTMKMAVRNNRKCIGIEISEEYCELATIRYLRSINEQ